MVIPCGRSLPPSNVLRIEPSPRLMAAIDLAALHLNWKTRESLDQIVESAWRWKLGSASRSRYAAHEV